MVTLTVNVHLAAALLVAGLFVNAITGSLLDIYVRAPADGND